MKKFMLIVLLSLLLAGLCLSREKGTNLHPKRTPVEQLLKNVLAENGGHLTLEKGATWCISDPL